MGLVRGSGYLRQPCIRVLANGIELHGISDARIVTTSCASANWFSLAVALGNDATSSAAFWSSETDITTEIQISIDGGQSFTRIIEGKVDTVALTPLQGIVQIEGRDFTTLLLSANNQETFVNQTSSEIASLVALRHGLTPVVTNTTRLVGGFDTSGHNYVTLNQFSKILTDWDLLSTLARIEDFDLYISGTTLYFQSPQATARKNIWLQPNDISDLRMDRMLLLGSSFQVTVKSWNSWQQQAVTSSVSTSQPGAVPVNNNGHSSADPQFILTAPNLTPDMADTIAQQQLDLIGRHQRTIEFETPGDPSLTTRDMIVLSGTGTQFNQSYQIESIEHSIGHSKGYSQRIRAKNSSNN